MNGFDIAFAILFVFSMAVLITILYKLIKEDEE